MSDPPSKPVSGLFAQVWEDFKALPADQEELARAREHRFPTLSSPRMTAAGIVREQKIQAASAKHAIAAGVVGLSVHALGGPTALDFGLLGTTLASLLVTCKLQTRVGLAQTALAGLTKSPLTYLQQKGLAHVAASALALQAGQLTQSEFKDALGSIEYRRQAQNTAGATSSPAAPKAKR